jgi:hypothetical protein
MLKLESVQDGSVLLPGSVKVEPCSPPELVSKGGVLMPNIRKDFDQLQFGVVVSCSFHYADHRGQLFEPMDIAMRNGRMGVDDWPLPVGSLVLYKVQQSWECPTDRDRFRYLSTSGLMERWLPGQFKLKKE